MHASDHIARFKAILRVASGNFLEMYDFMIFGYFGAAIGRAHFPAGSEFASLMLAFSTFALGFLIRPLGALVLGAYIDRVGRRRGLLVTLGLMSVGTLTIALVPGYASIGWLAPLLVVLGRICQGFSAGVELGGVSVYLSEIATPGNKGFYVAWQSASQQAAVAFAGVLGFALSRSLSAADMQAWGWRIPLLIGCVIIPFIFLIRRSLQETPEFAARGAHPTFAQTCAGLLAHRRTVAAGIAMVLMTTVTFYTITAYTPTFGKEVLRLSQSDALLVTLCVGLSNLFWLPLMGALSDRIGRRPQLLVFASLALLTAYPALAWLAAGPGFGKLLGVELWLSFLFAGYNGAMVVHRVEPPRFEMRQYKWPASCQTVAFSGNGRVLATGMQDGSVHFWYLSSGKDSQMRGYPGKVHLTAWTGNSRYLATNAGNDLVLWDAQIKTIVSTGTVH